ncbi:MAG TPA: hypothetical protein VNM48_02135, partial [Chloroflexota bacterium]|nr:hypothetical protein [Chloroflexota bacterium]
AGHGASEHAMHATGGEAHSHGFGSHTHAVPGADGRPVTWGSLLALGISGGLLPCPSALVLGLGAIALNRVAYGLVLILFFSAGLAATLMAIGLAMVYSGRAAGRLRLVERLSKRVGGANAGRLVAGARTLPVVSACVVALAGLALTADALRQLDIPTLWATSAAFRSLAANVLSVGLGALAVLFALRRGKGTRPANGIEVEPVHAHGAHEHTHAHGHNVHEHDHAHGHDHGHGAEGQPDHEHDEGAPTHTTGAQSPAYMPMKASTEAHTYN